MNCKTLYNKMFAHSKLANAILPLLLLLLLLHDPDGCDDIEPVWTENTSRLYISPPNPPARQRSLGCSVASTAAVGNRSFYVLTRQSRV